MPCGRLILTHRSHIKLRCINVFNAHFSQEQASEEDFLFLKEEIEAFCGAVKKLAPFAVYQSRCWTRAGGPNTDPLLPYPTTCGKCAPLSEIGRKVLTLEFSIERTQRTTPGHLRAAFQPSIFNPDASRFSKFTHPRNERRGKIFY